MDRVLGVLRCLSSPLRQSQPSQRQLQRNPRKSSGQDSERGRQRLDITQNTRREHAGEFCIPFLCSVMGHDCHVGGRRQNVPYRRPDGHEALANTSLHRCILQPGGDVGAVCCAWSCKLEPHFKDIHEYLRCRLILCVWYKDGV